MTSEIGIFIQDVEILITLAAENRLDLLICNPQSKFYLNAVVLSDLDFLTFCRIRQFILSNFGQVEIVGGEKYIPNEKDILVCGLLTAHRELATRDGAERDWSGEDVSIVLCVDIHEPAGRIAEVEHNQNLNIPGQIETEMRMTLLSFKQLLVNEGLMYSPMSNSRPDWKVDTHTHTQLNSKHETADRNPADDRVRQIYDQQDLEEMVNKLNLQPSDTKDILRRNLERMREFGASRRFARAPDIQALDNLQERFPNFFEVISSITRGIALSRLAKYPIAHIQPTLLLGEPGIGKTAFAKALAETFETHFFEIRMNSLTAGFSIGGHDLSWANGRPGILFNEVGLGKIINPVGLLDEIDKVSPDLRYDPLGHLFTLLESDTAKRFQDEAIPLKLNLSHICWLATANSISSIDPALLSRFTVFEVPAPTPPQTRVIARNIYASLLEQESWGKHFSRIISEDAIDVVTTAPPREARKILLDALGNAASKNRKELLVSDFNQFRNNTNRGQRVGFY